MVDGEVEAVEPYTQEEIEAWVKKYEEATDEAIDDLIIRSLTYRVWEHLPRKVRLFPPLWGLMRAVAWREQAR